MGKKEKGKDADQDKSRSKESEKGVRKGCGNAGGSMPYRLPPADRTVHVNAPMVLPPALLAESAIGEEDAYTEGVPRKLQLSHHALLTHPVYIGAVDNLLQEDECERWIAWGLQTGFEDAKQKQTSEMAFRDNGRIEFESEDIAQLIWLRLRPFVPETLKAVAGTRRALGCSPRIRVYRYVKGQRFGQHVDGSRDEPSLGGRTHFTVLVYLNGGDRDSQERRVKGGETIFWKDRLGNPTTIALAFPPTRGVCLFHGHGDECMIHEGAPVEDGAKYILRTDVVYEHDK
eukprot:TRINITY_DN72347_c0_g1_i1.p1 TRINITY_DN72347_c0_g1~~TRINITY_DN72347_c0_g1_i1.p1  ORF type:complete len:287 (+),score=45.25 TRINITY_DN72347_c0_g1_i1:238-1098(+)